MAGNKVREHLDQLGIKYVTITHSPAYTAQEIAESAHISGKEMAKTVIVMADEQPLMVVVAAAERVQLGRLKDVTGSNQVRLADESEIRDMFPGCDTGGMPPLGSMYKMDVYVSSHLAENSQIAFNAGTHSQLIRMDYKDFVQLERPQIIELQ